MKWTCRSNKLNLRFIGAASGILLVLLGVSVMLIHQVKVEACLA